MPFNSTNTLNTYRGENDSNGEYVWEQAGPLVVSDCQRGTKYVRLSFGGKSFDVLANDLVAAIANATNVNAGGL